MSNKGAEADRYAAAAFQALVESWQKSFAQVYEKLSDDHTLYALLMDGNQPFEKREAELVKALPSDVPKELVNLLKIMVQEDDLDLLPDLPAAFAQVASSKQQPVRADIVSAVELTDDEKQGLREALTKQFGAKLIFHFEVDPSLMGGLRVRVGDKLIDTSVSSRLASLRESVATIVR